MFRRRATTSSLTGFRCRLIARTQSSRSSFTRRSASAPLNHGQKSMKNTRTLATLCHATLNVTIFTRCQAPYLAPSVSSRGRGGMVSPPSPVSRTGTSRLPKRWRRSASTAMSRPCLNHPKIPILLDQHSAKYGIIDTWSAEDNFSASIPVAREEIDIFEAYFGDLIDELLLARRG